MEIEKLWTFKNPEWKNVSILQTANIIKSVLLRVKDILNSQWMEDTDINNAMKNILTRAHILDRIFNPLIGEKSDIFWTLNLSGDFSSHSLESNEIYHHTPSICVFLNKQPVFLNHNYIQALWAQNEEELKKEIVDNVALGKYYTPESAQRASEALARLDKWEWYTNLVLETKTGKKLSWNSFWGVNGFEIRIGNDISHGEYIDNKSESSLDYTGINLDTANYIKKFTMRVEFFLQHEIPPQDKATLELFWVLSVILDIIWRNGQFLMNITTNDDEGNPMIFNSKYAEALKRSEKEILEKAKNKTLWKETYDDETFSLITWLVASLKKYGHYMSEFPMKDSTGKKKIYSWLRFWIQDEDLWIDRTFWIGNSAISEGDRWLENFLNEK